jgi:hypothetical protein
MYFNAHDVFHSNSLFYLDLSRGMHELASEPDNNRRRELRAWPTLVCERMGLTPFVLEHHGEFMKRIGASPASRFSKETPECLCWLLDVLMVGAAGPAGIEAVDRFTYARFIADYFVNVPLPPGRRHATALSWHAAGQLNRLGVPLLNLGGGVREGDTVSEHKRRFGGRKSPFRYLKQIVPLPEADLPAMSISRFAYGPMSTRTIGRTCFQLIEVNGWELKMFMKSTALYDEMYHFEDYGASSHRLRELIQERRPGTKSLLDVGCGTDRHLAELRKDYAVEGVDLNPGMIEIAAARAARCPGIRCYCAAMVGTWKRGTRQSHPCSARLHTCLARHVVSGGLLLGRF